MNCELGVFEDQKGREVSVAGARQQGADGPGARGHPRWGLVLGNGQRLREGRPLTAWTHPPLLRAPGEARRYFSGCWRNPPTLVDWFS